MGRICRAMDMYVCRCQANDLGKTTTKHRDEKNKIQQVPLRLIVLRVVFARKNQ